MKISRRHFMASTSAALASHGAVASSKNESRPPNVIFIFPDQMRGQAMGCMGNPDVKTPNIDRLAKEGILFPNTVANTPVCCAARACLLTGKYASANGMIANDLRLRESETSIAELMGAAGYKTGFIGKWHLDGGKRLPGFVPPGPRRQGFDYWAANQCSHRHFDNHYFRDTDEPIPIKKFEPEGWTDLTLEFIQANQTNPFFLMVGMGPPHNPYGAPKKYEDMYDPEAITLRPNWKPGTELGSKEDIAKYYAAITAIDDQVGRILDQLDQLGLTDDTIVIFTSDHGDMLGSHGLRLKRKPHEESAVVPGIVRYPKNARQNHVSEAMFTHVDMAPTMLGLCGLDVPREMQGSDLSAYIEGKTDKSPDSAFMQIFGPYAHGTVENAWRGVRTERYMYARYQDKPWLLFDLKNDPYQMNNLVGNPKYAPVQQNLDARTLAWMDATGDSWESNWKARVEEKGALYQHETFYTVDEYLNWARKNPEIAPIQPTQ
ncbi:MAG: sulfatase [Candidatus Hinthialibacter antarcticus]|nr:sulfatase [Candidatus Hinthialibacter antarcticus]